MVFMVGQVSSQYGVSFHYRHLTCTNFEHITDGSQLLGFSALDAAQQAEVSKFFGLAIARKVPVPSPAKPKPSAKRPSAGGKGSAAKKQKGKKASDKVVASLEEKMPLEEGICGIEYAKVKKPSPCMSCSGPIANGEPRIASKEPSYMFEGYQTRWLHLNCACNSGKIERLSQLSGWDRM
jgi:hypothetical protein